MELSSCRGMNNAIQFTAMVEYFDLFGDGDFEEFMYIIRKMDNSLLRLENDNGSSGNKS